MSDVLLDVVNPSSSTAIVHNLNLPSNEPLNDIYGSDSHGNGTVVVPDVEEQALESHEVIELQTFSERKAWIEQKIKVIQTSSPCNSDVYCYLVPREVTSY